jgi:hypothetical protein
MDGAGDALLAGPTVTADRVVAAVRRLTCAPAAAIAVGLEASA